MLRNLMLFLGVINMFGPILLLIMGRIDSLQPGTGLMGLICLVIAEILRRQEKIERYLYLKEVDSDGASKLLNDEFRDAIPDQVEELAGKMRNHIAKKVNDSVVVDSIRLEKDQYRVSLLIGHALNTRIKTVLIPVSSADKVSAWQSAASEVLQQL